MKVSDKNSWIRFVSEIRELDSWVRFVSEIHEWVRDSWVSEIHEWEIREIFMSEIFVSEGFVSEIFVSERFVSEIREWVRFVSEWMSEWWVCSISFDLSPWCTYSVLFLECISKIYSSRSEYFLKIADQFYYRRFPYTGSVMYGFNLICSFISAWMCKHWL